jgi:hypothetical protein
MLVEKRLKNILQCQKCLYICPINNNKQTTNKMETKTNNQRVNANTKKGNASDLFFYLSYFIVVGMGIFAALCIGQLFVNLAASLIN